MNDAPLEGSDSIPGETLGERQDSDAFVIESIPVTCWRCGKSYDGALDNCPACLAANREMTPKVPELESNAKPQSPAIVRVVWMFVAMAIVSITAAFSAAVTLDRNGPKEAVASQLLGWAFVVEFFDTLIVLYALSSIQTAPIAKPSLNQRRVSWILALPIFLVVLAINVAYHSVLREILNVQVDDNPLFATVGLFPLQLVVICLQPAIVEELFFRRVAMGAVLEMMSPRWAVFITALLFALAHLGQPLSLPILGLIGIALGYLRLASGTLWLPMLFHFLHNLAILLGEQWL